MLPTSHRRPDGLAGVCGAASEWVLPSCAGAVGLSHTVKGSFNNGVFFLRLNRCNFLQREKRFSTIGAAFGLGVKN